MYAKKKKKVETNITNTPLKKDNFTSTNETSWAFLLDLIPPPSSKRWLETWIWGWLLTCIQNVVSIYSHIHKDSIMSFHLF